MYDHVREAKNDEAIEHFDLDTGKMATIKHVSFFILGLIFVVFGSNLLVENGVQIAKSLGVPDLIIGITMTAIGTSLPELVTCLAALRKGAVGVTIGNIIGADILNVLTVIGGAAAISPLKVRPQMMTFYIPYVVALSTMIVLLTFVKKDKIIKMSGFLFIATYLITTVISVMTIK
jgi:cation:H+ antiporter